jgi:hypothetical protein
MCNEGGIDRIVRVVVGLGLGAAAWFKLGLGDGEVFGIVAAVVALVLVVTGLAGFCPAYKLLGLRTCPTK